MFQLSMLNFHQKNQQITIEVIFIAKGKLRGDKSQWITLCTYFHPLKGPNQCKLLFVRK